MINRINCNVVKHKEKWSSGDLNSHSKFQLNEDFKTFWYNSYLLHFFRLVLVLSRKFFGAGSFSFPFWKVELWPAAEKLEISSVADDDNDDEIDNNDDDDNNVDNNVYRF